MLLKQVYVKMATFFNTSSLHATVCAIQEYPANSSILFLDHTHKACDDEVLKNTCGNVQWFQYS